MSIPIMSTVPKCLFPQCLFLVKKNIDNEIDVILVTGSFWLDMDVLIRMKIKFIFHQTFVLSDFSLNFF